VEGVKGVASRSISSSSSGVALLVILCVALLCVNVALTIRGVFGKTKSDDI
jgi:hypothetical protein